MTWVRQKGRDPFASRPFACDLAGICVTLTPWPWPGLEARVEAALLVQHSLDREAHMLEARLARIGFAWNQAAVRWSAAVSCTLRFPVHRKKFSIQCSELAILTPSFTARNTPRARAKRASPTRTHPKR